MIELPDGWIAAPVYGDYVAVTAPGPPGGTVTIDYVRRGYRAGYSTSMSLTSTAKYAGRGWKEHLERDAVRWLKEALA